ncbi:MAG: hypothetical protein ACEQSH_01085, partial [Bacteroidia bacterium]
MFWSRKKHSPEEADCIAQANGKVRDAEAEAWRLKKAIQYLKNAPWPEERGKAWVRDYCDAIL